MKKTVCAVSILAAGVMSIYFGACNVPEEKPGVTFTEKSSAFGLDDYGGNPAGCAFADYDNDGDQDIFVNAETQGDTWDSRLWENDGQGGFVDVAAARGVDHSGLGRGMAWGDYDNDGDRDLLVMAMDETGADTQRPGKTPLTKLYKNMLVETGTPEFEDVTVAAGILRQDNEADLERGGIVQTGAGAAWGDYDSDGDLDLYLKLADYFPSVENLLFQNNGDGTFSDVTREAGVVTVETIDKTNSQGSPNWVDMDNDGDLDLLVTEEGDKNQLFENNGDGTFSDVTFVKGKPFRNPGDCAGACWGDIDNDGDLDCYLVNADQRNRIVRNDFIDHETGEPAEHDFEDILNDSLFTDISIDPETGAFSPAADVGGGRGCTMGDFDNDGDLDVYVNNGGPSNVLINDVIPSMPPFVQFYIAWEPAENKLFMNRGDGTFLDATAAAGVTGLGIGSGVAAGDVNNDGFLDIYVMNRTYYASDYTGTAVNILQQNMLYLNDGNENNWIKIRLTGVQSSREAVGAHVFVFAGGRRQLREVTSSHGYNSQDDLPVEFGLGAAASVDKIKVYWPSGRINVKTDIAVNQMLEWVEEASNTTE
ncbi:CRTAC1 family protein [Thermodesulfobacteriota bacterium]